MRRVVEPELLDSLPPDDPQAVGSRNDLRRVNLLMGHTGSLTRLFRHGHKAHDFPSRPIRIVELGAGDGTLLLRLARRWSAFGIKAQVTLLDQQDLVSAPTRESYADLDWSVESVVSDVFAWLESAGQVSDLMVANLFLHHFQDESLAQLLQLAAARTNLFIACEPHRSPLALTGARMLGLMGCNAITRHDAVVSVRAGFTGRELSGLWPASSGWKLREQPIGLFSHGFRAHRNV